MNTYGIYDKEINFYESGLSFDELIERVKEIIRFEPERKSFYELDDETGRVFDIWDLETRGYC